MMMTMSAQGEFNFGAGQSDRGYNDWLAGRRVAAAELARRLGLPLGHQVEIWLLGGIRLRGRLTLREETLLIEDAHVRHLELAVDKTTFTCHEIESCVRTD